ncbi:MAG: hypothetical protein M1836_007136 [Candelina mexicana]|nr:MAG: hypothetical protein M1836_007136 [Candelina mexicana]
MRFRSGLLSSLYVAFWLLGAQALPTSQSPFILDSDNNNRTISVQLFNELEELSRIVDISYCVGITGIQKPFLCASRCQEFPDFELVTTWNTGPLLSDSCGYIVLSHPPSPPRIIIAFRGTYSIANTIVDLSTVPQEYVPYPGDEDESGDSTSSSTISEKLLKPLRGLKRSVHTDESKCTNCTVHSGFLTSWRHTRPHILPHIKNLMVKYPDYQLTLVGHSLGGAVAALASLDFQARGWDPQVTTFGEPRVGNKALMKYFDTKFSLGEVEGAKSSYRRVTHVDDPIPLLPLKEWGYRMHAGEVYISKAALSPSVADLQHCEGDEDANCIAGAEAAALEARFDAQGLKEMASEWWNEEGSMWAIPPRYRLWQLFFAHRDYFWRLGLCLPGGDPRDWYRKYPHPETDEL